MKRRTVARVIVLNALFQIELGGIDIINAEENALYSIDDEVLEALYPEFKNKRQKFLAEKIKIQDYMAEPEFRSFITMLINGIRRCSDEFDKKIESRLQNWNFDRVGKVEKNILKIALFEMFYVDDVPHSVSIEQAVTLAGIFSTSDAGKFVNGILGAIYKEEIDNGGKKAEKA